MNIHLQLLTKQYTYLVVGEVRLRRVGLYVDAMSGDLGQTNARVVDQVNLSANTSVKLGLLTVAPSYTLTESTAWRVDGLVGV